MLTNFFDWLKPASRRARTVAPNENDSTMARVNDHDPVYRAMMDLAYEMAESYSLAMVNPDTGPQDREYLAGRAAAIITYVQEVEGWRERARRQRDIFRATQPKESK